MKFVHKRHKHSTFHTLVLKQNKKDEDVEIAQLAHLSSGKTKVLAGKNTQTFDSQTMAKNYCREWL